MTLHPMPGRTWESLHPDERVALRQAAARLAGAHALARVEGLHDDGRPVVLFLCTHNAGRSQMALGFFQALAGDGAVAWSGGSEPGNAGQPARRHRHGRARHRHLRGVPQAVDG